LGRCEGELTGTFSHLKGIIGGLLRIWAGIFRYRQLKYNVLLERVELRGLMIPAVAPAVDDVAVTSCDRSEFWEFAC